MYLTPGTLLLAEPFIKDETFARAVILICRHTESGAFGLVCNKLSNLELEDVVPKTFSYQHQLFLGGPVMLQSLHYIYQGTPDIDNNYNLLADVQWSGNFEQLQQNLEDETITPANIRFFLGYTGWGANQLETELENNLWIKASLTAESIFTFAPNDLWREALKALGGQYIAMANYPINPNLN